MLAMLALEGGRAMMEREQPIPAAVREMAHTPAQRVDLAQGLEPWRRLPVVADDPAVGLSLADGTGLTAFHLLGTAFASAPHLLAAVQTLATYFPYACQAANLFEFSHHGETILAFEDGADRPPRALRDYVFAQLVHALRVYGWRPVAPLRVELHGLEADLAPTYRRTFGCRVQSTACASRIVLDTASLVHPLRGSNPSLHQEACLRLAADDSAGHSASRQALGTIEQLLDGPEPRVGAVASHLGISVRTLQMRLASEGFRYSDLLRRARQRRAVQMLCESETPISAIAHALGYRDPACFQRAFRRWYGLTPGHFRRHHCGR